MDEVWNALPEKVVCYLFLLKAALPYALGGAFLFGSVGFGIGLLGPWGIGAIGALGGFVAGWFLGILGASTP